MMVWKHPKVETLPEKVGASTSETFLSLHHSASLTLLRNCHHRQFDSVPSGAWKLLLSQPQWAGSNWPRAFLLRNIKDQTFPRAEIRPVKPQTIWEAGHHQFTAHADENELSYLLEIHFHSELVRIPLYYRTSMNEKKQTLLVRWSTLSRY